MRLPRSRSRSRSRSRELASACVSIAGVYAESVAIPAIFLFGRTIAAARASHRRVSPCPARHRASIDIGMISDLDGKKDRESDATRNVTGHSQSISINTILINKTSVPLSRKSERASERARLPPISRRPPPRRAIPPPLPRPSSGTVEIEHGAVVFTRGKRNFDSILPPTPPTPRRRAAPRIPYPLKCNLLFPSS